MQSAAARHTVTRLSFVIPTRNRAAFLRTCLDCCLAQAVPHSEIVVIDGRSTDDTVQVLESYGARIRFLSERDAGQADAVNKGVRLATGLPSAKLARPSRSACCITICMNCRSGCA